MTESKIRAALAELPSVALSDVELSVGCAPEDVARIYHDVGFVVVRGLMKGYVDRIHADVKRAVDLAQTELPRAELARYGWRTPSGAVFSDLPKAVNPVKGQRQLTVVPLEHDSSEAFRTAFEDRELVSVVSAILDGDVHTFGSGQCMYKEADGGTAMNLHQDAVYSGIEVQDVLTAYTYLTKTTLKGGCVQLVPYSYRLGLAMTIDEYVDSGFPPDACNWDDTVALPGEPGDTIFWHWNTIHGSKPNFESWPRPSVLTRFAPRRDAEEGREGLKQW